MTPPGVTQPQEFGDVLGARMAAAGEPSLDLPRGPTLRAPLFGVQESWKAAAGAADLVHLYEANDPSVALTTADTCQPQPDASVEGIAAELCLTGDRSLEDLARIRRDFALANHPDRVDPELRALATLRMTVANSLIDEAMQRKRGRQP